MLALFGAWELAIIVFHVPRMVAPRPSEVVTTLIAKWPALLPHAEQTLFTTLAGFALGSLAGVLLGVAVGMSRTAYDTLYPLLVGFASIPKVAVVPIFVIWFGSGTIPAVLTAMTISLFPVMVNVATGLATVEPEYVDVLSCWRASRMDILLNVSLPRALPYFFASLKVAITLAFVGSVISETVASNRGIGNVMIMAASNFDVPLTFAGLFILAIMGVALYAIFALLERRMTAWANRRDIAYA